MDLHIPLAGFHDPALGIRGVGLAILVDHRIGICRFATRFLLAALLLFFRSLGRRLLLLHTLRAAAASKRRSLAFSNRADAHLCRATQAATHRPPRSLPCWVSSAASVAFICLCIFAISCSRCENGRRRND
jgi:hypothetical protein